MTAGHAQESSTAFNDGPASSAPPQSRSQIKRRNYFVKKWLQTRYIIYYLLIMLASSIALFLLIHRYARLVIRTEMSQGHSIVFNTWSILAPEMVRTNIAVVTVVTLAAAAATLALTWTVRRASKTAASNIRAYCGGESTEGWAVIRHPREFQHLQNLMVESLADHRRRLERLQRQAGDLERISREAREAGGGEGPAADEGKIRELQTGFAELKSRFKIFKAEG